MKIMGDQETGAVAAASQDKVKKPVEYGILLFDERDHYKGVYETFFTGNLYDKGDSWAFYKAY